MRYVFPLVRTWTALVSCCDKRLWRGLIDVFREKRTESTMHAFRSIREMRNSLHSRRCWNCDFRDNKFYGSDLECSSIIYPRTPIHEGENNCSREGELPGIRGWRFFSRGNNLDVIERCGKQSENPWRLIRNEILLKKKERGKDVQTAIFRSYNEKFY